MRLVCPNCDAEYEVEASVIPDSGRDVQCSNCGHTWFEMPEGAEDEGEMAGDDPVMEPPEAAEPPLASRADAGALAILREEAAQEAAARRAEAPPRVEMQTEMGLDATVASIVAENPVVADPVADRVARLKGADAVRAAATKMQTRREMLPEIDEINSTLRASSERREGVSELISDTMHDDEPRRRSSFRNGFLLMIIIAVLLMLTYVMAPMIGDQIPGAKPAMEAFVAGVDSVRIGLDQMLRRAISFMNGLTSNQG